MNKYTIKTDTIVRKDGREFLRSSSHAFYGFKSREDAMEMIREDVDIDESQSLHLRTVTQKNKDVVSTYFDIDGLETEFRYSVVDIPSGMEMFFPGRPDGKADNSPVDPYALPY